MNGYTYSDTQRLRPTGRGRVAHVTMREEYS